MGLKSTSTEPLVKNTKSKTAEFNVKNLQRALESFEFDLSRVAPLSSKDAVLYDDFHGSFETMALDQSAYEFKAIKSSYNTLEQFTSVPSFDPSFLLIWKQVLSELRCQLSLHLEGKGIKLSVYSRLSIWERLWTVWRWDYGADELSTHLLTLSDLKACLQTSRAITIMMWHMKSDPLWSPSTIRQVQGDFFSEASLCEALNQTSTHLRFSLAPLEADIFSALDISVKRAKPRKAKAWFQFSLSAEKSLNQKKVNRLKSSAAIALISPYTLTLFLRDNTVQVELGKIYACLKLEDKKIDAIRVESFSRDLAQLMKKFFSVNRSKLRESHLKQSSEFLAVCRLVEIYVDHHLGQRARLRYKALKVDYVEHKVLGELLDQGLDS